MNSNGAHKEKRARPMWPRPKPTIYGNCDSWSFIVGKKPRAYSERATPTGPLQGHNSYIIHRFSTRSGEDRWDNLWAICGSAVEHAEPSRIVVPAWGDMRRMRPGPPGFYRKMSLARRQVSGRQPMRSPESGRKKFCRLSFFDHRAKESPKPEYGLGAFRDMTAGVG